MDYDGMDQLTDMGFTRELAAQALAATGGKSTLKATEWILTHRNKSSSTAAAAAAADHHHHDHSPQQNPVRGQVRVDHFFAASASKLHDHQTIEPEIPTPSLGQKNVAPVFRKTVADDHQQPRLLAISSDTPKQITSSLPQQNAQDVLPPPPAKRIKLEDPKQQQQQQQPQQKSPFQPSTKKKLKNSTNPKSVVPLAERMRPSSIDDIVGQDHLLGSRGILRSLLENDSLASVIFWGPPGTGKTSLARAIASHVSYRFTSLSAVTSGVKEVREVLEEAKKSKKYGHRTLLFLDEVHRFNKAQQDAFLPYVEAGHVVFIGATTENPSFEINAALLSRCKVLTLNKLQPADLKKLIERAIGDREKGVMVSAGNPAEVTMNLRVEDDAVSFLAGAADGDARAALNTLEIAVLAAASRFQKDGRSGNETREDHAEMNLMVAPPPGSSIKGVSSGAAGAEKKSFNILEVLKENVQHSQHEYTKPFKKFVGGKDVTVQAAAAAIAVDQSDQTTKERGDNAAAAAAEASEVVISVTFEDVKDALQRSHVFYDKSGEEHYNIISALHKSMRGGDPDAAIYWLARMIEGGEGPLFVARRLIRFASEDVGLADPQALPQAVACYQACHFLGMPECNVHLAQCVVYLALAPKSIAVYQAIEAAQKYVREKGQNEAVPLHLRNAPTKLMKELGYSKGYIYPPSHKGALEQEFMPTALRGLKFLPEP